MSTYNESNSNISILTLSIDTVNGDDDVITIEGSGATLAVSGDSNTIQGSDDTISLSNDASQVANVVDGSNNIINVADYSHFAVNGGGDTINQNEGFITIGGTGSVPDLLIATNEIITMLAGSSVDLQGGIVAFTLGTHCVVNATGDNASFAGSDDRIAFTGATYGGDSVTGDHNRILVAPVSQLILDGDSNYVHMGEKASTTIVGSDERLVGAGFYVGATGVDFWIGGTGADGDTDLLSVASSTIRVGANSNIDISGNDDTLAVRANSHVYVTGSGLFAHFCKDADLGLTGVGTTATIDTVTGAFFQATVSKDTNVELATFGATAYLGDDVALTLERSNNTVTAGNSNTIDLLWGSANTIVLGQDDTITDGGSGTVFSLVRNVGASTVANFAADSIGVVDVAFGLNGYTTAQAVFAALISDGAGGMTLSLGADGSVDFLGDTSLTAANFKVG